MLAKMKKLYKTYQKRDHYYKKWFWRSNYIVAILLYIYCSERVLLMYTLLCSVYANEETSAGADEAVKAQKS